MSRLKITDLEPGQCRFPITPDSAPSHFFCGEPVEYEKCPYCPAHAARCFDRRAAEVKAQHRRVLAMARAARSQEGRRKGAAVSYPATLPPFGRI